MYRKKSNILIKRNFNEAVLLKFQKVEPHNQIQFSRVPRIPILRTITGDTVKHILIPPIGKKKESRTRN